MNGEDTNKSYEKYNKMSFDEIFADINKKKHILNDSKFDGEAWKVKILYAQKISNIFENSGKKENEQLFSDITNTINGFIASLSRKEKRLFLKAQESMEKIYYLKKALSRLERNTKLSIRGKNKNEFNLEKYEQESGTLDNLYNDADSIFNKILDDNWKIRFIIHLQKRLPSFSHKIDQIKTFKKDKLATKYIPKELRDILEKTRHKVLFSNFGINFLIHDKDWPIEAKKWSGEYFSGTPFSVIKIDQTAKKETRSILNHEGTHNIFNSLFDKNNFIISGIGCICMIDENIQRFDEFKKTGINVIIGRSKKHLANIVINLADYHINENKDEILANFEGLSKGESSTDISKYHRDRELLYGLKKKYQEKKESSELIDKAITLFEGKMKSFYQQMTDYFFVANNSGKLKEMKLLIYLINLEEYDIIRSYLISEIGEDLYNSYISMRTIINPLGIEGLITREKRKKQTSSAERMLKLIFGGNSQFEEVLKPDKIQYLSYYFKNYKKFDPEKKFKNNRNLRELISDDTDIKISQILQQIKQLKNNDNEKIKLRQYLKNLKIVKKNGEKYLEDFH